VLHHGLNKAALFLAAGSEAGATAWRRLLLALPALSLVGLPLTSGELAKAALKGSLADSALGAGAALVLGLASMATALLMLRVWWLAGAQRDVRVPVHPAWPLLVLAGVALPWWQVATTTGATMPDLGTLRDALWPPAAAMALAWAWRRAGGPAPVLPAGDILVPLQVGAATAARGWQGWCRDVIWPPRWPFAPVAPRVAALIRDVEAALVRLPAAGVVLLVLAHCCGGRWFEHRARTRTHSLSQPAPPRPGTLGVPSHRRSRPGRPPLPWSKDGRRLE
jgi:hypothetical protein